MCTSVHDDDGYTETHELFTSDTKPADGLWSYQQDVNDHEFLDHVIYPEEPQESFQPWGYTVPMVKYLSGTRPRTDQKLRSRARSTDARGNTQLSEMSWLRLSQRNGCPLNTLQNYDIPAIQIGVEPTTYRYVYNNGVYRSAKNLKAANQTTKMNTFVSKTGPSGLSWEQRVLQREIKRDLRDMHTSRRELVKSDSNVFEGHGLAHCPSNSSISTTFKPSELQVVSEHSRLHSRPITPLSAHYDQPAHDVSSPILQTERSSSAPPRSPSPVHLPLIAPLPALPLRHDRVTRSLIERLLPDNVTFDKVKQDTEQRFQLWKIRGESRESSHQASRGDSPPKATVVNNQTFSVQSLHRKESALPQNSQDNVKQKISCKKDEPSSHHRTVSDICHSAHKKRQKVIKSLASPDILGSVLATSKFAQVKNVHTSSLPQNNSLELADLTNHLNETLSNENYPTHANSYIPPYPHTDDSRNSSKSDQSSRLAARTKPPHDRRRRSNTQDWLVEHGRIVNDKLPGYTISHGPKTRQSSASSERNSNLCIPQLSGKRMNMRVGPQRIL